MMVAHVLLAKSGERVNDLHFEIGAEFQDSLDFNFCEPRARKIALLLGGNKSTWIEEWEEKQSALTQKSTTSPGCSMFKMVAICVRRAKLSRTWKKKEET